jgi:hypothetical protein
VPALLLPHSLLSQNRNSLSPPLASSRRQSPPSLLLPKALREVVSNETVEPRCESVGFGDGVADAVFISGVDP